MQACVVMCIYSCTSTHAVIYVHVCEGIYVQACMPMQLCVFMSIYVYGCVSVHVCGIHMYVEDTGQPGVSFLKRYPSCFD